jgi:hypothetical protein
MTWRNPYWDWCLNECEDGLLLLSLRRCTGAATLRVARAGTELSRSSRRRWARGPGVLPTTINPILHQPLVLGGP